MIARSIVENNWRSVCCRGNPSRSSAVEAGILMTGKPSRLYLHNVSIEITRILLSVGSVTKLSDRLVEMSACPNSESDHAHAHVDPNPALGCLPSARRFDPPLAGSATAARYVNWRCPPLDADSGQASRIGHGTRQTAERREGKNCRSEGWYMVQSFSPPSMSL